MTFFSDEDEKGQKPRDADRDELSYEQAVTHRYVRAALDAILANTAVAIPETKPVGCTIKWKA